MPPGIPTARGTKSSTRSLPRTGRKLRRLTKQPLTAPPRKRTASRPRSRSIRTTPPIRVAARLKKRDLPAIPPPKLRRRRAPPPKKSRRRAESAKTLAAPVQIGPDGGGSLSFQQAKAPRTGATENEEAEDEAPDEAGGGACGAGSRGRPGHGPSESARRSRQRWRPGIQPGSRKTRNAANRCEHAGKGKGLRGLLQGPEQEACRRRKGHPIQPVRERDGEGRQQRKACPRQSMQGDEQKTHQRSEGNRLLALCQRRSEVEERPVSLIGKGGYVPTALRKCCRSRRWRFGLRLAR